METTQYERQLVGRLEEKGLSPSSIQLYLRNLQKINGNQSLKNLGFLKDTDSVLTFLNKYKENTRRSFLIAITSVLQTDQTTAPKKKLYQKYFDLMKEKNRVLKAQEKENKATPEQVANHTPWEQVLEKHEELKKQVEAFQHKKQLTEEQYNTLLQYVVLSLYVLTPTRRNLDYQRMVLQGRDESNLPNDRNYLLWKQKQFLFRVFKTAKKEGEKREPVPPALFDVLELYRRHHPYYQHHPPNKQAKGSVSTVPLLVDYAGKPLLAINSITRILNQIFQKRTGSSALRHAYLSSKYGAVLQEMKDDADAMSHSLETQKNYILYPEPPAKK